jgi:sialate O-acetylesterase
MRFIGALLLAAAILPAQTILITKGAADYQVFQRDDAGFATIALEGKALVADGKTVEARVSGGEWKPVAKVAKGQWAAKLEQVATGGPYKVEVRMSGTPDISSADHLLVGDLWVLAGQSNMEGVGNLANTPQPSVMVNSFDMTDRWVEAKDPLHRLVDAVNRVHWPKNKEGQPEKLEGSRLDQWIANRKKGAGVGLPFALEMVKRTGVPIGLVPCAHGGTSMDQWSPALKEKGGDSLYGGMLRRVQAVGGRVKGILWYQGESDANAKAAPLFEEKFKALVAAVRTDTGQADLPFYYVQIGRHVNGTNVAEWNSVQDQQWKVEGALGRAAATTCVDCRLDDGIHVGTDDFPLLGARLANLACHDLYPEMAGCQSYRRGPRPVAARFENGMVTVTFAEVNGKLMYEGRLNGFTIHGADGAPLPLIYRERVDPNNPSAVQLFIGGKLPEGARLHYGWGKDPYVNLRDEAGMAALVFGPMVIAIP